MSNDGMRYFAVWSGNIGYALDAYPEEIEPYRREMVRRQRSNFAGPFDTHDEAMEVVTRQLKEGPV